MNICVFGDGVMGNIVRQMLLEGEDCVVEPAFSAAGPVSEPAEVRSTTCEPATAGKEVRSTTCEPAAAGKEPGVEEPGPAAAKPEGMIDFSYPGNIQNIYESARKLYEVGTAVPVVIATTGYNDEQMAIIEKIAEFSPVMLSSNFSYGINCMAELVEHAMAMTGEDTDVEIIEKHHNRKTDVPSGTALMLAKLTGRAILCGRSTPGRRGREVGVHSVRGGNIFGEHTVIFAMDDEVIEIKHTAYSRRIFAKGAIEAVHWLEGKPAGMYNVLDCLTGLC